MEKSVNMYPVFSDGEVLTAERLNEMVEFLAGQPEDLAKEVIGTGIVSGLEITLSSSGLSILPGVVIFPDGSIIRIRQSIRYPFLYSDNSGYFFSEKELSSKKRASLQLPDDRYVVALVKCEKKSRNVCNQTSCDINHAAKQYVLEPRLKWKANLEKYRFDLTPTTSVKSFTPMKSPYAAMSYKGVTQMVSANFNANREQLCRSMCDVIRSMGIITSRSADHICQVSGSSTYWLGNLFEDWKSMVNRYVNAITRVDKLNNRGKGTLAVPPFFLDFLDDMRQALQEFVDAYNVFCRKYRYVLNRNDVSEDTVILSAGDRRTLFRPAGYGKDSGDDLLVLKRLFERIYLMSEHFVAFDYDRSFRSANVQLVLSRPGGRLGEKPVPCYYKKNDSLANVWQAHLPALASTPPSYHELTEMKDGNLSPLGRSLGQGFVYSLQGVYDMKTSTAYSALNDLIGRYDLPLTVSTVNLTRIRMNHANYTRVGTSYYDLVTSWLNSDFKKKVADFDISKATKSLAEIKHNVEKNTRERKEIMATRDKLSTLQGMKNIGNILKAADAKEPLLFDTAANAVNIITSISPHQFKLFCKYFDHQHGGYPVSNAYGKEGEKIPARVAKRRMWSYNAVAAFSKYHDYLKRSYLPQYRHAHRLGARDSGQIILLQYKGKVVMCLYL